MNHATPVCGCPTTSWMEMTVCSWSTHDDEVNCSGAHIHQASQIIACSQQCDTGTLKYWNKITRKEGLGVTSKLGKVVLRWSRCKIQRVKQWVGHLRVGILTELFITAVITTSAGHFGGTSTTSKDGTKIFTWTHRQLHRITCYEKLWHMDCKVK